MQHHLKRVLKGSLVYGLGHVTNSLLQFFLLPAFTSVFPSWKFGLLSSLIVFATFFSSFFSFGFGSSIGIIYFNKNNEKYKSSVIWTAFLALLLICISVVLVTSASYGVIDEYLFENKAGGTLINLAVVSAILIVLEKPFITCLQFEEKLKVFIVISLCFLIINFFGKIVCVWGLGLGIKSVLMVDIISRTIVLLLYLYSVIQFFPVRVNKSVIKLLFQYGIPMMFSFFFLYYIQQGGVFFIQKYILPKRK